MAYSRWSESEWYAFWASCSGLEKGSQVLSLWTRDNHSNLDYETIEEWCFTDVMDHYGCTEDEAMEAMIYIEEFVRDVENEFVEDGLND